GTPGYIAPEQASASAADLKPTADIYSLGAILFDLLAGRPPFLGAHALSVIRQASELPAPKLRTLSKIADRDLETVCSRCLERDPKLRYPSAHDLAEDLERWLEGRPIIARPVSPPVRIWRWTRRNPLLAGSAAACVLVAAIALARQTQSWRLEKEVAAQLAAQHSIEVSVFVDLDSTQPNEKWTRTFATELTNALQAFGPASARIGEEVAIPQNFTGSSNSPAAPTRAILCGTLRKLEGKLRISLHLLDANSRELLMQRMVEVDGIGDASSAALAIASDAYSLLSSVDLTKVTSPILDPGLLDSEARRFIDAGVELANRRGGMDFDRGIGCLQHAIELQPKSSAAHAALAKILTMKSAYQSNRKPLALAQAEARKAVELAPTSSESRLALAAVLYHQGKAAEAIEENLTALEYSPWSMRGLNLLSNIYKTTGHPEKALACYSVASKNELKPGEGDAHIGDCWSYLVEDDPAETAYNRYFQLHPEQPDGWMGLCRLRLLQGRATEARSIYRQETKGYLDFAYSAQMAAQVEFFGRDFAEASKLYSELYAQDPDGGGDFYAAVTYASALGRLKLDTEPLAAKKLLARAREMEIAILEEVPGQPTPLYRLAAIDASLGAVDSAFAHLDAAAAAGWIDYRSTALDPRFDLVRHDPRFDKYLSRLAAGVAELKRLRPVASAAFQTAK
ncbi:MAG: eukaryotic-like serine/threonine-protein kinase, partial [Verrucomicrobiota bacterium]